MKRGAFVCLGRRAQISMEFMLTVGVIFLLTIPLLVIFFKDSQSSRNQMISAQVSQIARHIISAVETVQAFGTPTSVVVRAYMPPGVNSSSIEGTELVFVVNDDGYFRTIAEESSVEIRGEIMVNPGIHTIKITAGDDFVNISDVSAPY